MRGTNKADRRLLREKRSTRCCGGWLIGFTIAFFVLFLVLIFTVPSDAVYEYRDNHPSILSVNSRDRRTDCPERYDAELAMCVPRLPIPDPIVEELKDTAIDPCQSFYHHSCGNWIRNHTNEDRAFTYVFRKNRKRIRDIATSPSSGAPYLLYRSCLDTLVHGKHKLETAEEIKHLNDHILSRLHSHKDLPMVFGRLTKYGLTAPFGISIENHPTEPRMIPLIMKTDNFLSTINIEDVIDIGLAEMAQLELLLETLNNFQTPTNIEEEDLSYTQYVKTQFPQDIHNFSSAEEFWKQYFLELGGPNLEHDLLINEQVWIPSADHAYVSHLLNVMETIPIEQWRVYVKYSILYNTHNYMPILPTDSYFRHHGSSKSKHLYVYHRRALDNIQEKHCIQLTNQLLPGMMAKTYMDVFMPNVEETRQRVVTLAEDIRSAYVSLIDSTSWLTVETRQRARDKISNIIIRAVHPNTWETEPFQSRISKTRYVGNLNLIRQYRVQRNLQLWSLYKTTEKSNGRDAVQRFGAPLTTVNAYYSPVTNTITVFAGIVSEPFYHKDYSPVALYATLGMIIGHELSHGMDNSGRLFDANGSLTDWWPVEDVDMFLHRAQCIVREYGPPQGCENVNYGEQTLGEDIADITGITLALNAYESRYGSSATMENRQKFFTIFAQMWAESYDQAHLCNRVDNDVHAVAWFRVDKTLRQLKSFQQAFNCPDGSGMVNKNKCTIYG